MLEVVLGYLSETSPSPSSFSSKVHELDKKGSQSRLVITRYSIVAGERSLFTRSIYIENDLFLCKCAIRLTT